MMLLSVITHLLHSHGFGDGIPVYPTSQFVQKPSYLREDDGDSLCRKTELYILGHHGFCISVIYPRRPQQSETLPGL